MAPVQADPLGIIALCNAIAQDWARCVCPVYVDSDRRFVTAQGIGTMFPCAAVDTLYLMTASHVIRDSMNCDVRIVSMQGHGITIANMLFQCVDLPDIAVAEFSADEAAKRGMIWTDVIPLDADWSGWVGTGIFYLLGFPASKNELKGQFGRVRQECLVYQSNPVPATRRTQIPDALALFYAPKKATDPHGKRVTPPDMHGMSGGPCLEIMMRKRADGLELKARLHGIIVEYFPQDQQIIVSPLTNFILYAAHDASHQR